MKKTILKLKAVLVSEDGGKTWRVFRQFYVTDFPNGPFHDDLVLVGKTFRLVDEEGGGQCQK